jgi:dihydrodipicolinate synthase/N-acetylneuraminate lyase
VRSALITEELRVTNMLGGTLAAALTPLADGGAALDEEAISPYVDFLVHGGVDGLLALGTTGEGVLLSVAERQRVADLFIAAADRRVSVAVHCGAQTSADTVALAEHAARAGADAVAVIGPSYYALDEEALCAHFAAAASACEPVPFYLYEFAARTGYAVPLDVIERLRRQAPNLVGLKVSDRAWEDFAPYLIEGLDVFVGPEVLIRRGVENGAAGAVSGLASVFPEDVVRAVKGEAGRDVGELRGGFDSYPFHAAAKHALARRGVPVQPYVRAPLRQLTDGERARLDEWLGSS